jgi:hypothetical protein
MPKYVFLVLSSLWVAACAAHDDHYYQLHPKLLQRAIEQCSLQSAADTKCEQLKDIAVRINQSAYQLRMDPQGYGQQILSLQALISKQETSLREQPEEKLLQESLHKNKRSLQERLAIVKWLESPEG